MRYSKYRNKKVTVDGIKYDSKLEAKRGQQLIALEKSGKIKDLRMQVRYDLVVNDRFVCWYRADFDYWQDGEHITEDAKGMVLPDFKLKARLFHALFGREVRIWPEREGVRASLLSKECRKQSSAKVRQPRKASAAQGR